MVVGGYELAQAIQQAVPETSIFTTNVNGPLENSLQQLKHG